MYIYNGIYNIYMDQLKWNIQYLYGSMGISICIYIYILKYGISLKHMMLADPKVS